MNCPQCGSGLPSHALQTKLVQCTYCDSTLLLEANRVSKHTLHSQVSERQSLLAQGGVFRWREHTFTPQGFIQYEHDNGYLTDWWVTNEQASFWLSENDENCFLTQEHVCALDTGLAWATLHPNRELTLLAQNWLVTQKQILRYNGMNGALPITDISPKRHLIYLAQPNATTLLLECADSGADSGAVIACRQGSWLDPFEIERIQ